MIASGVGPAGDSEVDIFAPGSLDRTARILNGPVILALIEELAPEVLYLRGRPPDSNVYILGDVMVDSATRLGARRLLRRLAGRQIGAHALTHVHPPTQGASAQVAQAFGIPIWCGEHDAIRMETGTPTADQPDRWFNRFQQRVFAGPGHPVDRRLREGDEVGGFTVLETPGHAPGHVAFWREQDRVLVLGDVVTNENVWIGLPGLREPPPIFTSNPSENRRSAHRLAALKPALICFSHGKPLHDTDAFLRFVQGLPA
jgi:glyoxylase-like metal-dependent hydrolase (beta-lactamase superfamily II)